MTLFAETLQTAGGMVTVELSGTVAQVLGLTLRVADLALPIGAMVRVESRSGVMDGEVVGFDADMTIVMLLGDTAGIRRGDRVVSTHTAPMALVGDDLLGRVVNGMGEPIDGMPPLPERVARPLRPKPVAPMDRVPIRQPLGVGVRAIDTMLPIGRGQRLGVFAGPGIGKSTLLGMMSRHTEADVTVVAMIGERGREVRDFIENNLGEEGLRKSVVVAATADEPALMRIRAALYANSVAEYFRDQGLDVLLVMDSVTRFCQAQRQVGLAAGEPPATKGFTPSVFAALPVLLERAGKTEAGSITGLYAILVEGDDLTEPISDACRGILDGHVVLSRAMADRGHWPAIDVLASVSRVSNEIIDAGHEASRRQVTRLITHWREVEDLVNIGAYAAGSNPDFDLAIEMRAAVEQLLQQSSDEAGTFDQHRQMVQALALRAGETAQQLQRHQGGRPGAAGQ